MSDSILGDIFEGAMSYIFVTSLIGLGATAYCVHQETKAEERQKERDWQSEENRKMREHFAQYGRRG